VPQDEFERSRLGARRTPGEGELLMYLGELEPETLEDYLGRLKKEDLSETVDRPGGIEGGGVGGEWVDACTLDLALPGRPERHFVFSQYDSLSLSLSRVVTIVRELPTFVVDDDGRSPRIPHGYEGRLGDILERKDGQRFEVVGYTTDEGGLELQGLDLPITLYIAPGELRGEFRSLVSRGAADRR
jgi:hypothetical protein